MARIQFCTGLKYFWHRFNSVIQISYWAELNFTDFWDCLQDIIKRLKKIIPCKILHNRKSSRNMDKKFTWPLTRKASASNILTLLTLLSADANLAVVLRVPSLTKVEIHNFSLLHFPRWPCLIHGQHAISLRRVEKWIRSKFQCLWIFDIKKWSIYLKHLFLCLKNFSLKRFS